MEEVLNYIINPKFKFDVFDDGDVIAVNSVKNKQYLLNKTTWFAISLFVEKKSYSEAEFIFVNHYDENKEKLSSEFLKIFNNLLQSEIIKEE